MTSPDTSLFTLLHDAMRADSERLARAARDMDAPERARTGAAMVRWYRGFRAELLAHHQVEDEIFMPALLQRAPELAAATARVDADHHVLDEALERVRIALDAVADVAAPWDVAHLAAVEATADLRDVLQRHLGFEDDEVVPRFADLFDVDEYEALDAQAKKHMRFSELVFTLPWIMDNADAEERTRMLGEAPLAFKFLWYATRRRYARLAHAALGAREDAPIPVA